jgi:drug/metabolite transporter (DMT)-like permease
MRPGTVFGALLILAGVIVLSVGGFSLTTLPPLLGGLAIIGGVVLIVVSSRKAR